MELYGLTSLIDENIFGDERSFRAQFGNSDGDIASLRRRLLPFIKRTLRRDVLEYVPYTQRHALTTPFTPSEDEQRLYELVSAYLQRDFSYGFPQRQKHLVALILRKLLASSTEAVDNPDKIDFPLLRAEIAEVKNYLAVARSIREDQKSHALLNALDQGFTRMAEMGAARKAVIFTESRRTQEYLARYLEAHGHAGKVATFRGTNQSESVTGIYQRWLAKYTGTDRVTGSPAVDRRTALIDQFSEHADILIATEAAAEGVNLQFCSLVINYDLPWNPQRVEQRIGRCHRYGQKHDVVVINFLNQKNEADIQAPAAAANPTRQLPTHPQGRDKAPPRTCPHLSPDPSAWRIRPGSRADNKGTGRHATFQLRQSKATHQSARATAGQKWLAPAQPSRTRQLPARRASRIYRHD